MSKHLTSRSNWNLEMWVFMEGGKPEYPEKNPWSTDENRDTGTGNRIRATVNAKTNCYSIERADPGETLSLSRLVSYAFCNFGHFVLLA